MIGEVHYNVQDAHTWLMDSVATFDVTPNIEWFSNYSVRTSGTVRLGYGQECKIAGTGEVPIQLPNGNTITLHQVRHVPALKLCVLVLSFPLNLCSVFCFSYTFHTLHFTDCHLLRQHACSIQLAKNPVLHAPI